MRSAVPLSERDEEFHGSHIPHASHQLDRVDQRDVELQSQVREGQPRMQDCYAKIFAERFRGVAGHPYEQGFDLRLVPEKLVEPLRWSKSQTVFVNSMSDVFLKDVPDEYIALMAAIMLATPWHTYQVLTKRSKRMLSLLQTTLRDAAQAEHIWWGVSVEDRKHGVPRICDLVASPASVRFLSIEPLLDGVGTLDLTSIHWVIVGGESGRGARPMERSLVESTRSQCEASGVPFFFKQWGGVQKRRTGRELNGRTYDARAERNADCSADREARTHRSLRGIESGEVPGVAAMPLRRRAASRRPPAEWTDVRRLPWRPVGLGGPFVRSRGPSIPRSP